MTVWSLWKNWRQKDTQQNQQQLPKMIKCWYLTKHEVYSQNRPGKIHIVFKISAEFQEKSTNTDLANQIVKVLLRSNK